MLSTGKVPWSRGAMAWAPSFISWIDRMNRKMAPMNASTLSARRRVREPPSTWTAGASSEVAPGSGASPLPPRTGVRCSVGFGFSGSFPMRSRGRGPGGSPYLTPSVVGSGPTSPCAAGPLVPFENGEAIRTVRGRAPVGRGLGRGGPVRCRWRRRPAAAVLRPGHVPVPLRGPPHGPRGGLRARRRHPQVPVDAGVQRVPPGRLGLLRSARGERRDPAGDPSEGVDVRQHREAGSVVPALRRVVLLVHAAAHLRSRVLPVDPVAVPAAVPPRAGLPEAGPGELVPQGPDGAGQRAGGGGGLL